MRIEPLTKIRRPDKKVSSV